MRNPHGDSVIVRRCPNGPAAYSPLWGMSLNQEVRLLVDETEDPDVIVLEYVDRSLADVVARDSLDRDIMAASLGNVDAAGESA